MPPVEVVHPVDAPKHTPKAAPEQLSMAAFLKKNQSTGWTQGMGLRLTSRSGSFHFKGSQAGMVPCAFILVHVTSAGVRAVISTVCL